MQTHRTVLGIVAMAALMYSGTLTADTKTWTGGSGGTGTSWSDAANWDGGVPGSGDTAKFTNVGLTAGKVITLDAAQAINTLEFDSTLNFTIGNAAGNTAGHTLTVVNVTRSGGSSGTHTIAADLLLPDDTLWTVAGAERLQTSKISGTGAIEKQGSGELRFGGSTSSRSGLTMIGQGTLSATDQKQLGSGNLIVGNGVDAATFASRWNSTWNIDLIGDNAAIIVKNNAIFDLETFYTQTSERTDSVGSLTVEAGGIAKLGRWGILMGSMTATNVTMRGGLVTGVGYLSPISGTVLVDATATEMPTISSRLRVSYKYSNGALFTKLLANDVPALPVDLLVEGQISNIWDDRDGFDKTGAGVVKITGSNTYGGRSTSEGRTRVQAGTLLVDNTAGSGTGKSYVPVSAGATLGGTGTVGGLASSPNANVALAGAAGNPAVLAPGSIDDTTGAHVFGTLTVGSEAQTNNVTFGSYSTLRVGIGVGGEADRLTVDGVLSLATGSDVLEIAVSPDAKSGTYVLASATGGITGTFDTVTGLPAGRLIDYTATTIELTIPPKGTVVVVR